MLIALFLALTTVFIACGVSGDDICDPNVYPDGIVDSHLCPCGPLHPDGSPAVCDSGPDGPILCIPGMQVACACPGGSTSVQVCADDGRYLLPCQCGSENDGGGGGSSDDDAGDASADGPLSTCTGECVPDAPLLWEAPVLLWFGPAGQAPSCPASAPEIAYGGHDGLDAPNVCGECRCSPATGTCSLPASLTAYGAHCSSIGPGTPHSSFDPPQGWDGSCTATTPALSGVQSVTIAPAVIHDGCTAQTSAVDLTTNWATYALGCVADAPGSCGVPDTACASTPPAGFSVCIARSGDLECPDGVPYTEKHVFYGSIDDTRSCSPCACGAAAGSTCSTSVALYPDGACASSPPLALDTITSAGPICIDVPPGSMLGSKSASAPSYQPGACPSSGGDPSGAAIPADPTTFCCIPSP